MGNGSVRPKRFLIEAAPTLARMLEAFLFSPFNREYSFMQNLTGRFTAPHGHLTGPTC